MESTASHKKIKVFRSKQEIARLLKEHAQSGLGVKAFCAGLPIAEASFKTIAITVLQSHIAG